MQQNLSQLLFYMSEWSI